MLYFFMRNEDLEKKVIKHSEKDYYQTTDTIRLRIIRNINKTKFTRDPLKNREILGHEVIKVLSGYEKHGILENWGAFLMLAEESGNYKGMLTIHIKGYSTFTTHPFTITRGNKIFSWD